MNREEANKRSDEALAELAEALRKGRSDTLIEYLDFIGRFHQYSFCNCMLIALQMPTATHVAGFGKWKTLGRWVRKGEKCISILAPIKHKRSADEKSDDPEASKVVIGFRIVSVFDVSQTDGKELPQFATLGGDPGELQGKLEDTIAKHGIALSFSPNLCGANGLSMGGAIEILDSLPPPQKFSTTVHEFAHELLHKGDRRENTSTVVRETEAEAVAYAVCRWAGIDCSTRAADYIQLYTGDEKLLLQSLELIRDVAASIITALDCTSTPSENSAVADVA